MLSSIFIFQILLFRINQVNFINFQDLCCGPMPANMQRLSACMTAIIGSLECPVCLNTISPPACQCVNGHLICIRCHAKSEKCPVCRVRLSRGRCLFADQVMEIIAPSTVMSQWRSDKEKIFLSYR